MPTPHQTDLPLLRRCPSQEIGNMLNKGTADINWTKKQFLAKGGEGFVYKVPIQFVHDGKTMTRWCVLKKLRDQRPANRQLLAREETLNTLLTNADESSTAHHIIKLIQHVDGPDGAYSLYPYCELILDKLVESKAQTNPLAELATTNQALHLAIVTHVARDLLIGLQYAHNSGIIHRDVKLQNIGYHLGRWCLLDWGLATQKAYETNSRIDEKQAGTVPYMHPQSFKDMAFGRTWHQDIFALGRVLEFLMDKERFTTIMKTNKNPLELALQSSLAFEIAKKDFPDTVADFKSHCPSFEDEGGLKTMQFIIQRMLSINPAEQPTAEQLQEPLQIIEQTVNQQLLNCGMDPDKERMAFYDKLASDASADKPIIKSNTSGRQMDDSLVIQAKWAKSSSSFFSPRASVSKTAAPVFETMPPEKKP